MTGEENLVERQVPCYGPGCHYRDPKKVTSEENLVERQVPCYGPGCHYRDPKRVTGKPNLSPQSPFKITISFLQVEFNERPVAEKSFVLQIPTTSRLGPPKIREMAS